MKKTTKNKTTTMKQIWRTYQCEVEGLKNKVARRIKTTSTNNINMKNNITNTNEKLQRVLEQRKIQHQFEKVEKHQILKLSTLNLKIKLEPIFF
jgi:hypothetical protein